MSLLSVSSWYWAKPLWPCTHCLKAPNQTFICIPQGPACCSTRLLSVAILSHRSIQHVAENCPSDPTGGNHYPQQSRTSCLTLSTYLADRLMPVFTWKRRQSIHRAGNYCISNHHHHSITQSLDGHGFVWKQATPFHPLLANHQVPYCINGQGWGHAPCSNTPTYHIIGCIIQYIFVYSFKNH